jgi:hypothetical protein
LIPRQRPHDFWPPKIFSYWTTEEVLKERLGIAAFATPEIATVLFLQDGSVGDLTWVQHGEPPKKEALTRRSDSTGICGILHSVASQLKML